MSNAATGDHVIATPSETTAYTIKAACPCSRPQRRQALARPHRRGEWHRRATGDNGVITFDNKQSITYTSFESLGSGAFQFSSPSLRCQRRRPLRHRHCHSASSVRTVTPASTSSAPTASATTFLDYTNQSIRFPFADGVTSQMIRHPDRQRLAR